MIAVLILLFSLAGSTETLISSVFPGVLTYSVSSAVIIPSIPPISFTPSYVISSSVLTFPPVVLSVDNVIV